MCSLSWINQRLYCTQPHWHFKKCNLKSWESYFKMHLKQFNGQVVQILQLERQKIPNFSHCSLLSQSVDLSFVLEVFMGPKVSTWPKKDPWKTILNLTCMNYLSKNDPIRGQPDDSQTRPEQTRGIFLCSHPRLLYFVLAFLLTWS